MEINTTTSTQSTTPIVENQVPVTPATTITTPQTSVPSNSLPSLKKSIPTVLGLVIIIIIIAVAGGAFYLSRNNDQWPTPTTPIEEVNPTSPEDEMVACTADAQECPDGSFVGRTGPTCEFVCPNQQSDTTNSAASPKEVFESTTYPFKIAYSSDYQMEVFNPSQVTKSIQQLSFQANVPNILNSFSVRIDNTVSTLPKYPMDSNPTGTYQLTGVEGVYLSLPNGYGDGGGESPPALHLYFIYQESEYHFTFFGTSDINDPEVQEILHNVTFVK